MKAAKITRETIRHVGAQERKFPQFEVGDTIAIHQRIKEGDKERLQVFEGDVIKIRKYGISSNCTVRRIGANSVPVERIFPLHSPLISSIELVRKGDVRRAKLYYMRKRIGKAARVKEKILTRSEKEALR
jgi:large subunit ribosomal protein L19